MSQPNFVTVCCPVCGDIRYVPEYTLPLCYRCRIAAERKFADEEAAAFAKAEALLLDGGGTRGEREAAIQVVLDHGYYAD